MTKRITKFILVLILLLAAVYAVLVLLAKPVPDHPFFDPGDQVLVISHRGGRGARNPEHRDNKLGFRCIRDFIP